MAQNQSLVSKIGWDRPSTGTIVAVIAVLAAGLGLLSFLHVNARLKNIKDNRNISLELFNRACRNAGLVEYEKSALQKLIAYMPEFTRPHQIFESASLFERCVDARVNKLLSEQLTPEQEKFEDDVLLSARKKLGYNVIFAEQPLISTRNLSIGQKVSVLAPGQKVTHGQAFMVVEVSEFYFTVRVAGGTHGFDITSGTQLIIAFSRMGDAVYSIGAKIKGAKRGGEIQFFHTLDFSRNQNRRYVRLDVNLPIKFRVLEKSDKKEKPPSQYFEVRISEISGGGLSFFADSPVGAHDTVMISIPLPDGGGVLNGIKGQVLRVVRIEGKTTDHFRHHIQFINIEPQHRERIVKFVFTKHRQMLQMR
ncbi:MAG: PilZ domain-containing protein [Chitinispirillales bacterium]|jgi:c-di-GMP-binding flagellar brake protein YcgR|nr:PilZ domain-containing protein [Chitinispirillales bacterium]